MLNVYGAPSTRQGGHEMAYDLLTRAYEQVAGSPLPPIDRTETGKPYFVRNALEFSLTHTKTMAFCALSSHVVGIDAETVRPVLPRVLERTMNPAELAWIDEQPDRDRAFLQLWTAKEAWVKLTGTGLQGCPKSVVLQFRDGQIGVENIHVHFYSREIDGVLVTVCAPLAETVTWQMVQPDGGVHTI